jgi:Uncharacterized protein conserved in bacteria (DUF2141)
MGRRSGGRAPRDLAIGGGRARDGRAHGTGQEPSLEQRPDRRHDLQLAQGISEGLVGGPRAPVVPHHELGIDMRVRSDSGRHLAIACFHDENKNGKLDTGLFGIPTEGTVASNHARGFMGPPSFDKAKFSLAGAATTMDLRMGY